MEDEHHATKIGIDLPLIVRQHQLWVSETDQGILGFKRKGEKAELYRAAF